MSILNILRKSELLESFTLFVGGLLLVLFIAELTQYNGSHFFDDRLQTLFTFFMQFFRALFKFVHYFIATLKLLLLELCDCETVFRKFDQLQMFDIIAKRIVSH
jgi:hypothetical protein